MGWLLLRASLHDPLLVLNVESELDGGNQLCDVNSTDFLTWVSMPGVNLVRFLQQQSCRSLPTVTCGACHSMLTYVEQAHSSRQV